MTQDRQMQNWKTLLVLQEARNSIFSGNTALAVAKTRGVHGLDTANIRDIIAELAIIDKRLRCEIAVCQKKIQQEGH